MKVSAPRVAPPWTRGRVVGGVSTDFPPNCPSFPGGNQELPLGGSHGATLTGEGTFVPCSSLDLWRVLLGPRH